MRHLVVAAAGLLGSRHDGQLLDIVVPQHGGREAGQEARLVTAIAQHDRLGVRCKQGVRPRARKRGYFFEGAE